MPSVPCVRCGYENHLHQRFCGMCGSSLVAHAVTPVNREEPLPPPPPSVTPREEPAPPPRKPTEFVSGPSFLGLESPRTNVDYLFEEPVSRDYGRLYALLIVVALVGGLLVSIWFLRREPSGWLTEQIAKAKTVAAPVGESAPPDGNTNSSAGNPAPQSAQPATPTSVPAADNGPSAPVASPKNGSSSVPAAVPKQPPSTTPPAPSETSKTLAPNREDTPAPTNDGHQDAVVSEGENYLYGHHVPQDCGRARSNLVPAAESANPRAQILLGTMYATGHCVPRNMPMAYHWFTQAHQEDPRNGRVEQDLRLVWNQMTAQEQNAARAEHR